MRNKQSSFQKSCKQIEKSVANLLEVSDPISFQKQLIWKLEHIMISLKTLESGKNEPGKLSKRCVISTVAGPDEGIDITFSSPGPDVFI